MKTRNTLFMAALAATVTIVISAEALHSTSASVNTLETVSLADDQNDGGVSSNVGFILFSTDRDNPIELGKAAKLDP